MDVEVSFYGNLVRLAGARTRTITVGGDAPTVHDLREAIRQELPQVASHLNHTAVGVGVDLLPDEAPLPPGAEVALLPPVSGG